MATRTELAHGVESTPKSVTFTRRPASSSVELSESKQPTASAPVMWRQNSPCRLAKVN